MPHSQNYRWTGLLACFFFFVLAPIGPLQAKLNVVASIKPVHSLVAGVMLGVGKPHLLVERGSPHSYVMRPSDARAMQNADIMFWVGPELETFLAKPLRTFARNTNIIALIKKTRGLTVLHVHSRQKHPKKHHHGHSSGGVDPHIWLDPENARALVVKIAGVLARKDPQHKNIYWSNAQKMTARLEHLNEEIQSTLAPLRARPYLTFHDDFRYFERRYNLAFAGSLTGVSGARPGARHLRNLQTKIRNNGIKCVFLEPQFKSRIVEAITNGTPVRTHILDPLGAGIKKGPELYFSLLKNNTRAFKSCLGRTSQ